MRKASGGNKLEDQEYETIDLREILLLLKKHLLELIAVAVLFAVAGYLLSTFVLTPKYEASATMIVNSREDSTTQTTITSDQINSATKLVDTYSVRFWTRPSPIWGSIWTMRNCWTRSPWSR